MARWQAVIVVVCVAFFVHGCAWVDSTYGAPYEDSRGVANPAMHLAGSFLFADAGWIFEAPRSLERWWNEPPQYRRLLVGLVVVVLMVPAFKFAPEFFLISMLASIGLVAATVYTRNFFWVFVGINVALGGFTVMCFYSQITQRPFAELFKARFGIRERAKGPGTSNDRNELPPEGRA